MTTTSLALVRGGRGPREASKPWRGTLGLVLPARGGCFDAASYLFFDRAVLAAMREAGRQSAEIWLAAGPRVDRIEEPEDAYSVPPRQGALDPNR